jgi:formylglycine-generating enzyme required for sulfatase activity
MRKALRVFGESLKKDTVGLFYYAGHGVQVSGQNYLIPVGADIQSEDEVPDESISASSVLRKIETANNRLNIIILDACRNNPFAKNYRDVQSGLARVDAPLGSIVAYSTAPGAVAADGRGRNGIYTKYLLRAITTPQLSIEQVFKNVRNDVIEATRGKQVPWEETSLRDDFYFVEGSNVEVAVAKVAPKKQNLAASGAVKAGGASLEKMPTEGAFRDKLESGEFGPWMLEIPSGEFTMGGDYYNEKPKNQVTVDKRFAISVFEITNADFGRLPANEELGPHQAQYTDTGTPAHPRTNITWGESVAYIERLAAATGKAYRLPSEAEWEFVARGAQFKSDVKLTTIDRHCANCDGEFAKNRAAAVSLLDAEIAGTRGMLGNVWEWTQDCWIETYDRNQNDTQPRILDQCGNHALRGGSFNFVSRFATPSSRIGVSASTSTDYIGFRVVRELE